MVVVDEPPLPPAALTGSRFDRLFRARYGELYGLAYRLIGDRHEAEDVVQEAFLRLSGAAVLDRPDEEVAAWLRRVCLNAGHNRIRSRTRAVKYLDRVGRLPATDSDSLGPLPAVLRDEEQQAVRRALATLPDRQRACLVLRHSGHSYAEIASTLDLAIGSVGVLLARAESTFRANYSNEESDR